MSQIMDKKLYQLNQYQLIKSYGLYQNKPSYIISPRLLYPGKKHSALW